MADVEHLVNRIRNEFVTIRERFEQKKERQLEEFKKREERLEKLERAFDALRETWRPRLEAFATEFGDHVKVTPDISPGKRQAILQFKSPLATIRLRFSASSNAEVTRLVVAYDLDILPILMEFQKHSEISFPLDEIDSTALTSWLDDRMIEFVQNYLAVHENPYYLKGHMVEDPIARVKFPDFTAATTRTRGKTTYHFLSEETAAEFDRQKK